jgi:hypothetical protein
LEDLAEGLVSVPERQTIHEAETGLVLLLEKALKRREHRVYAEAHSLFERAVPRDVV